VVGTASWTDAKSPRHSSRLVLYRNVGISVQIVSEALLLDEFCSETLWPVVQTEFASYDAPPAVALTASVRPQISLHQEVPFDIQQREPYWADCPAHSELPLCLFRTQEQADRRVLSFFHPMFARVVQVEVHLSSTLNFPSVQVLKIMVVSRSTHKKVATLLGLRQCKSAKTSQPVFCTGKALEPRSVRIGPHSPDCSFAACRMVVRCAPPKIPLISVLRGDQIAPFAPGAVLLRYL
jgi:hypothetical protein